MDRDARDLTKVVRRLLLAILAAALFIPLPANAQLERSTETIPFNPYSETDLRLAAQTRGGEGSGLLVFIAAGLGSVGAFAWQALSYFGSDQDSPPAWHLPVYTAAGASAGAMLGSVIGGQKPAILWSVFGAAVVAVPFIVFAPDSGNRSGRAAFWIVTLPVVGSTLGNRLGQ